MARFGNILVGIFLGVFLYLFLSGYYLHERQRLVPLFQRNCRVLARCFVRPQKVPTVVHYLVDSDTKGSANMRGKTRENNPGYTVQRITSEKVENMLKAEFSPRIVSAYRRIHPIYTQCKRDFLSYVLMYLLGGVFLENDCWAKSLCKLIEEEDEMLLSQSTFLNSMETMGPRKAIYQRWWLVAVPKHPFFLHLIHAIAYNIENVNLLSFPIGQEGGNRLTGEVVFTESLERMVKEGMTNFRTVCSNGNGILRRTNISWGTHAYPTTSVPILQPKKIEVGVMTPNKKIVVRKKKED
jgi:hypothetical protein